MRRLELWIVIAMAILAISLNVLAVDPAGQWTSWDKKPDSKDEFFGSQSFSETELAQIGVDIPGPGAGFSAAATQSSDTPSLEPGTESGAGVPLLLLQTKFKPQ